MDANVYLYLFTLNRVRNLIKLINLAVKKGNKLCEKKNRKLNRKTFRLRSTATRI